MLNVNTENLITTRALAKVVKRADERIRQLEDEGILESVTKSGKKYFDLVPSVNAFIDYLDSRINPSASVLTEEQIALADLRYKTARAGKAELELAELQNTMHRAEDVEEITSSMIAHIRAEILALPGRLAVDVAKTNTPREAQAVIKAAVDELLNGMARYKYDSAEYKKLVREREKWINIKEAETAKKETAKKTTAKKAPAKKIAAKKTVKKRPASSKTSAVASKRRKT